MEVWLRAFLTSVLDGRVLSVSSPDRFNPGNSPRYNLNRMQSAPQSWSGRGGRKRNPHTCQESKPDSTARSLVTILNELLKFFEKLIVAQIVTNSPHFM